MSVNYANKSDSSARAEAIPSPISIFHNRLWCQSNSLLRVYDMRTKITGKINQVPSIFPYLNRPFAQNISGNRQSVHELMHVEQNNFRNLDAKAQIIKKYALVL